MMTKVTISITPELDGALDVAAVDRGMNKSRLVETLLREHKALQPFIEEVRSESSFNAYAASRRASARKAARRSVKAASASG